MSTGRAIRQPQAERTQRPNVGASKEPGLQLGPVHLHASHGADRVAPAKYNVKRCPGCHTGANNRAVAAWPHTLNAILWNGVVIDIDGPEVGSAIKDAS